MRSAAPLEGTRILDLSWHGPGHAATWLLAELGAEVIAVEPPGGDPFLRRFPPLVDGISVVHLHHGRGKRSFTVNLRDPRGRDAFLSLADTADAVVDGMRPGVAEDLGIGYETIRARNARITYCSVSGFGSGGPLETVAGHDLNYVTQAGMFAMSRSGERPRPLPLQAADYLGSALAALGVLAGIENARRTGEGVFVEASLLDAALFALGAPLAMHLMGSMEPGPDCLPVYGTMACYDTYRCADGRYVSVAAVEPEFFARLCELLGLEDCATAQLDPRRQDEIRSRIEEAFAKRTRDEWLDLFDGEDVCVAPVLSIPESAAHPHVRARQGIATVVHPNGRAVEAVASPLKIKGLDRGGPSRVPEPGQDTASLLEEIGMSQTEIETLVTEGVITVA